MTTSSRAGGRVRVTVGLLLAAVVGLGWEIGAHLTQLATSVPARPGAGARAAPAAPATATGPSGAPERVTDRREELRAFEPNRPASVRAGPPAEGSDCPEIGESVVFVTAGTGAW